MPPDQANAVDPMQALVGQLADYGPEDEDQPEGQGDEALGDDENQQAGTDEPVDEGADPSDESDQQPKTETVELTDENGIKTEKQVTLAELKKGYMLQADYTRKTQQVAQERTEVVQAYTQDLQRFHQEAQQAANQARAVLAAVMGQKSHHEMYELAANDPAEYAKELARQNTLRAAMDELGQNEQQLSRQANARLEQQQQNLVQQSVQKLAEANISREALSKMYNEGGKLYGFSTSEMQGILDARIVLVLRDALEFQRLKTAKPNVAKRAASAAPMPNAARAPEPQHMRQSREVTQRFSSGKATLHDLAAVIKQQRK